MKPLNLYKHIAILLAILFSIFTISCSSASAPTTVSETKLPETTQTPTTTVVKTTTTTEAIKEVDAPEIAGLTFNQETKSYFNEAGVEMGIYLEEAVKINGEIRPAIGLKPEIINKILEENRQEGIFKCPWSFDFKEIKEKREEIEIVELV